MQLYLQQGLCVLTALCHLLTTVKHALQQKSCPKLSNFKNISESVHEIKAEELSSQPYPCSKLGKLLLLGSYSWARVNTFTVRNGANMKYGQHS